MKSAKLNLFVLSIIFAGAVLLLMSGKSEGVDCTHKSKACQYDCFFTGDELRPFSSMAYPTSCNPEKNVISIGGSCGRIYYYSEWDYENNRPICATEGPLIWNPKASGDCDTPE
jgi:hypothetical protein